MAFGRERSARGRAPGVIPDVMISAEAPPWTQRDGSERPRAEGIHRLGQSPGPLNDHQPRTHPLLPTRSPTAGIVSTVAGAQLA